MSDLRPLYDEAVRQLMRLPSVGDIRAAARELTEVPVSELRNAFAWHERLLESEQRIAELELLRFVRDVALSERGGDHFVDEKEIRDAETLLQAASAQPNALRMLRLISRHRLLVNAESLSVFLGSAASPLVPRHESRPMLKAAHVAALIIGDREHLVKTYLIRSAVGRQDEDWARAERMLRRAEQIARTEDELQHVWAAQGAFYRSTNRFREALTVFEKVLEQMLSRREELLAASTYQAIADCRRSLGEHDEAINAYTLAVEILERHGIAQMLLRVLNLRGLTFEDLGRYDEGFADYTRAAEIAKEVGDHNEAWISQNNAAATFMKRGIARESYERFDRILREAKRRANPAMIASTYNNLGQTLLQMDQPDAASSMFWRALALKVNREPHGEAIAFLGLGDAMTQKGEKEKAQFFYSIALVPALQTSDLSLQLMWATRAADAATPEGTESLTSVVDHARAANERSLFLAGASALFDVYIRRRENDKALALYEQVAQYRGAGLDLQINWLDAKYARLLVRQGQCNEALRVLENALCNAANALKSEYDDTRQSEIVSDQIAVYGAVIEALTGCEDIVPTSLCAAFDVHESVKARDLLARLAAMPSAPPDSVPAELAQRETELLRLEHSIQEADSGTVKQRSVRLRKVGEELEQNWAQMAPFAPDYVRYRSGKPYAFAEIAARVREACTAATAFVSLFCDQTATTAFVFRPGDAHPRAIRCAVTAEDWESIARRMRRAFNGAADEFPPYPPLRRAYPEKRKLDFFYDAGAQLKEVMETIEEAELVVVAPHGPLHLLPFHAFKLSSGAFLAERSAVVSTVSISAAVNTITRAQRQLQKRSAYVAAISSLEDRNPDAFTRDVEIFDGLPCNLTAHLGFEAASRTKVLHELPLHDIVHLSCHGFFDSRDATKSGLLVSNGRELPPRNPWAVPPMERRKYLITAADLRDSEFSAELVTLNACSTALQRQRNAGDELDGFTRALLRAGASSILVGLWNMDQHSSREFLAAFYRSWLDPVHPRPKWQALHEAQMSFLHKGDVPFLRHPYHWAPFILTGDWR